MKIEKVTKDMPVDEQVKSLMNANIELMEFNKQLMTDNIYLRTILSNILKSCEDGISKNGSTLTLFCEPQEK